jgi:Na+-driven multidrug efflux pump
MGLPGLWIGVIMGNIVQLGLYWWVLNRKTDWEMKAKEVSDKMRAKKA